MSYFVLSEQSAVLTVGQREEGLN